jgi:hypothetical protein
VSICPTAKVNVDPSHPAQGIWAVLAPHPYQKIPDAEPTLVMYAV